MKWKSSETYNISLEGPSGQAVSCDFTDELETMAVKRIPVEVFYGLTEEKAIKGFVRDFHIKDHIEYMLMSDGTEIPLKEILKIKSL